MICGAGAGAGEAGEDAEGGGGGGGGGGELGTPPVQRLSDPRLVDAG